MLGTVYPKAHRQSAHAAPDVGSSFSTLPLSTQTASAHLVGHQNDVVQKAGITETTQKHVCSERARSDFD